MRGNETPSLNISNAEGYSTAIITVTGNGTTHTTQTKIPANGNLTTSNFFHPGCSYAGDQTFSITVKLRDRVGNVGEPSSPASFTIRQCILCMPEGGSMVFPLHVEPKNIVNPQSFGTYAGTNTGHSGNDYSILPSSDGQPIYAAHVGKIVEIRSTQDDDYNKTLTSDMKSCLNCNYPPGGGYGNYVLIEDAKNPSLKTKYAHLKPGNPYNLKIGDIVGPNNAIGNMGTTGFSTGPHLHFETQVGGIAVDPALYLGTNPQKLTPEEQAVCENGGAGGNAGGLFSLSNEEIADEASKEIEIEHKQSILGYSVAWINDQEVPFKNVEIQTDEGKINLPFPKVMVNKRDQDFGTIVIHNERLYQNDQEISPGFMLSPDFKIFEQFYLEDTDTGQKFYFNDCVDYPNIFARSAGECWLDSSGKPKPILKATEYIKTYKIKGTLRRLIKENLIFGYEEYRTPKNDSIIELLGSPLRDDPSANMAAVIDGDGSDVPDMRYRLGYDDFIQTIADSACILSNFVVSPFGSYVYCQAVYRMLIGAGINPGVNEMALQAENISMATLVSGGSPVGDLIGLKRFFVSEVAQAGLANQASRQFTEEATNGILNREFAESASLKANARNGSQALIDSIGGASQLAKNGREVFEAAKVGVTKERQELVARSISKPRTPEKIDSSIFSTNQTLTDDIMGSQYNSYDKLPRTLKTGQPKSINYDGSTLTSNYEMKWYSNPVSLTYQLRLEIFLTLKEGKTFVLITKNGSAATDVNAPFRSLMEKYQDKIKIEKFISQ